MKYYLIEAGLLIINWLMAWWESRLIKNNRPIYHGWWGALYALILAASFWDTRHPFIPTCGILIREVFFSPILNKYRGKAFFYIDMNGTSLIDRLTAKIQIPLYFTSLAALVALQFFLHD